MSQPMSFQPLRFDPSFEQIPEDESQTIDELTEQLRNISEKTFEDSGHGLRSVHAKSHGLVEAQMTVLDNLPPELAQGLFAHGKQYPVVMRFSTNPGDILEDKVSTPRGLAIKVIGVEGARLDSGSSDNTQDFVMVNAPAFTAATPKAFLANLKMLAKTTDKAPGLKKALSAVLRGTEAALEAVGGKSGTIVSLGGHPMTHILGETFYTTVPLLYGDYFAKLSIVPVANSLTALTDAKVDMDDKPNALREVVNHYFAQNSGEWEVRVQLATDIEKMPIEDASKQWPEDLSPYVTVARIVAGPQTGWSEARSAKVDDGLAFGPWHCLAAHRPLGGIMRARRKPYEMSSGLRAQHNGCPMHEPRSLDPLP
jgi:hypothetical protein